MEELWRLLDVALYGAAVIGGFFAVYWIYNSTNKERRALARQAAGARDPQFTRWLRQGVLLQRLGFAVAAVATGGAILLFARGYFSRYGVNISVWYFLAAGALIVGGAAAGALAIQGWVNVNRKE